MLSNRVRLVVFGAILFVAGITFYSGQHHTIFTSSGRIHPTDSEDAIRPGVAVQPSTGVDEWDSSRFLKGPPADSFRDNLHGDMRYITAWANAGFTNEFMSHVNMIYLGLISGRIPIIPPFAPDHHMPYSAGALLFSNVFNLTRARQAIRQPLLDWSEVKNLPSSVIQEPRPEDREQLGCWSSRHQNDPNPMRTKSYMEYLRFDVSYTRIPMEARHNVHDGQDDFLEFGRVVPYIFPRGPKRPSEGNFPIMQKSPFGHSLPPDDQLTCFDCLYFMTSSRELYEWRDPWSPAWRFVGTHLRFNNDLVDIVRGYLARAFQVTSDKIPPFIAVHMRRGDFAQQCPSQTADKCLIPLDKFVKKVDQVRRAILQRHGQDVTNVILMSDEKSPKFWRDVKDVGWVTFDHFKEKTEQLYGKWHPVIFDQIAQSMAAGFVGTEDSTFSLVAQKRVEDWNDGVGLAHLLSRTDVI